MLKLDSLGARRILIYGGTGSLGKRLIERLAPDHEIIVYSRDEAKHWTIKNNIAEQPWHGNVKFMVGDIRDPDRIFESLIEVDPHVVILAAALKQVDTCERTPNESVLTNVLGTQNVITAVKRLSKMQSHLDKVLFVSTDKACSPVNTYGMCKAISERLITSVASSNSIGVKFFATRYGNVLESRGSIIPLFKYQAEHHDHLTVTDPNMTRFLMTLDDSVDLIIKTLKSGRSGETWIPKIASMRIGDLADIFSKQSGKSIKIIGPRPGEKQHEDLINASESARTTSLKGCYVIGPACRKINGEIKTFSYSSDQNVMSPTLLFEHLTRLEIIDRPLSEFAGRSIEEIATTK